MKIGIKCPVRIDFTGGFTDVNPFCANTEAHHINAAINSHVNIVIEPRNDGKFLIDSPNGKFIYPSFKKLKLDNKQRLISTAYEFFSFTKGVNLYISTEIPSGAGLGTSGALSAALVAGLYTINSGKPQKNNLGDLAVIASKIENAAGNISGLQDCFAAVFGKINQFSFYKDAWKIDPLNLSNEAIDILESRLLIAYPGGSRMSGKIVKKIMVEYTHGNHLVSDTLNSLNELSTELYFALKSIDLNCLVKLTKRILLLQEKLYPKMVTPKHKKLLKKLGVPKIGCKLLGGGGPGACILILCSTENAYKYSLSTLVEAEYQKIPVKIARDGIKINFLKP